MNKKELRDRKRICDNCKANGNKYEDCPFGGKPYKNIAEMKFMKSLEV